MYMHTHAGGGEHTRGLLLRRVSPGVCREHRQRAHSSRFDCVCVASDPGKREHILP